MTQLIQTDIDPQSILASIRRRGRRGMSLSMLVAEVVDEFGISRSDARRLLHGVTKELEIQGEIVLGRGKRFFPAEVSDLHPGLYRRMTGGGFVVDVDGDDGGPVWIAPSGRRGALHGDRVLIRFESPHKRARLLGFREGVVIRVVEKRTTEVVGVWVADGGRPHVRPLGRGQKFTVEVSSSKVEGEPREGELVAVTVDHVEARGRRARGVLLERLGLPEDAGAVDRAVLRLFGITEAFDPEVESEANALPEDITERDLAGRWDLRESPAITIDPVTARDFDDAVSARPLAGDAIEVEVHIADVGHYVRRGTFLDTEAQRRSTSVYLPGLCVPMLPERLSNELCSLREGVDRLCFSVRFRIGPNGHISRVEANRSVIHSRRRCTYEEVFDWLEQPRSEWPAETAPFADSLELLAEAAARLSRARHERGSLDFDMAEPQILLDPEGRVVSIAPSSRNRAHRLVEELMVAANMAVARLLLDADQPCLHRVHDEPNATKIETLAEVVEELGFPFDGNADNLSPSALQALLERVAGKPEEHMVSMLVLRSMARAVYTPDPRGHYALATNAYLHFTSPIRRYPDLVAHRTLQALIRDGRAVEGEERDRLETALKTLGPECSAKEQEAEKAERTAVQWKTALFLRDRVGEVFTGRVSGVVAFGVFVQLEEVFADVLIHIKELLDDYYEFDERRHRLVGERTGRVWRLGDKVKVRLMRVDLDSFQIEAVPVDVKPDRRAMQDRDRQNPGSQNRGPQNRDSQSRGRQGRGRRGGPPSGQRSKKSKRRR